MRLDLLDDSCAFFKSFITAASETETEPKQVNVLLPVNIVCNRNSACTAQRFDSKGQGRDNKGSVYWRAIRDLGAWLMGDSSLNSGGQQHPLTQPRQQPATGEECCAAVHAPTHLAHAA